MKDTLVFLLFVVYFPYSQSLFCSSCTAVCPRTDTCKGGVIHDRCGCCKICAKTEWEPCGIDITGTEWLCDAGLVCMPRNFPVSRCEQFNCGRKRCGLRQLCELNRHGKPVCVCPRNCKSGKWRQTPVCGKNGKQYTNACELYRHECLVGEEIGVMWPGPCKKCYFDGKTYTYGDTRKGELPCEKCTCHHGQWRCRTRRHCADHLRTCTVFQNSSGAIVSTCPPGYWCKVQIPGIPEQGIPEVGVCVAAKSKPKTTTVAPTTNNDNSTTSTPTPKPVATSICELPMQPGDCRAAIQRWYYNKNTRKCSKFLYGGCGGNANKFLTKSRCRNACMRKIPQFKGTPSPKPTKISNRRTRPTTAPNWSAVCKLAPATGPCRAAMPQWYYNPKKRRCVRFIYGGCGGNDNNFDTKEECKAACMRRKGTKPTPQPTDRLTAATANFSNAETTQGTTRASTTVTTTTTLPTTTSTSTSTTTSTPTATDKSTERTTTRQRSTTIKLPRTTARVPRETEPDSTTAEPTTRRPTWEVPMKVFTFRPPKTFRCLCTECLEDAKTCATAFGCYTEHIEHDDGREAMKYGCIESKIQYALSCNTRPSGDVFPRISLDCCTGEMCNEQIDVLQKDKGIRIFTTQATVVKETAKRRTIPPMSPRCFDAHSKKFYGERAEWKPNDCTVCSCMSGRPECVATVCRHPDCVDAIRVKGQCCPVCPIDGNHTAGQRDMIKALAESQLTTVHVTIKKDKRVCEDINSGELYLVGQSWKLDDCTTCYCQKNGKVECALQMCGYPTCSNPIKEKGQCCPVCLDDDVEEATSEENEVIESPHSCSDPVTGDYYRRHEMWQQDDCTACICGTDRKLQCTKRTCPKPPCENPVTGMGRCCPVCPTDLDKGCVFESRKYVSGTFKLLADDCTLCECMTSEWKCSTSRCWNPRPGE